MHRMICEVASDTPFGITHGRKRCSLVESSKNLTAFMTLLHRLSSTQASIFHFPDNQKLQEQVAFQSNANHPLAESMGYIKFEGM